MCLIWIARQPSRPVHRRVPILLSEAEGGAPEVILIGTGSEVSLCVAAQARLKEQGIAARVVSMPSWDRFEAQSAEYPASVLPPSVRKRVAVEAGCTMGWHKFTGDEGAVIGVDHSRRIGPRRNHREGIWLLGRAT
jgi:transketolase